MGSYKNMIDKNGKLSVWVLIGSIIVVSLAIVVGGYIKWEVMIPKVVTPDVVSVRIDHLIKSKMQYEVEPTLSNLVHFGNAIDSSLESLTHLRDSLEDRFFYALAVDAGNRYDVNWRLLYGIWKWESSMNPKAKGDGKEDKNGDIIPGSHRAFGLGQVHLASARDHYDKTITIERLMNPVENGHASAAILKAYMTRFDDNEHYGVSAYNAGPNRIQPYYKEKTMPPNFWNYNQRVYKFALRAELTM